MMTLESEMGVKQISIIYLESKKLGEANEPLQFLEDYFNKNFPKSFYFEKEFIKAFVHKSFVNEHPGLISDNERLEFLGDSVLQIIISKKLFLKFPNKKEGQLSKLRSALVNEKSLAKCGRILGFEEFLVLGKGEVKENGHKKDSLLANTVEAYLGQLFLSSNLEVCQEFIETLISLYNKKEGKDFIREELIFEFDAKTKLQEIVMKKYKETPEYKSVLKSIDGQDLFEITLSINNKEIKTKLYPSKKKGMQLLAKEVLESEYDIK